MQSIGPKCFQISQSWSLELVSDTRCYVSKLAKFIECIPTLRIDKDASKQKERSTSSNIYSLAGLLSQLGPLLLTWFNFNPSMDK